MSGPRQKHTGIITIEGDGIPFSMPNSYDAETALLGCLLYKSESVFIAIRDLVKPEDFYHPANRVIAQAAWTRCNRGQLVDGIMIHKRLENDEVFDEMDAADYLATIIEGRPDEAGAPDYAKLVSDFAARRLLILRGADMIVASADPETDLSAEAMYEADKKSLEAMRSQFSASASTVTLGDATLAELETIGQQSAMGIRTGITELDQVTGGMHRGDFIVLGGRPSMGKTALAGTIMRNVARQDIIVDVDGKEETRKGRVGFFSLEMKAAQIGVRSIAAWLHEEGLDQIEYRDILNHDIDPSQRDYLISKWPKYNDTYRSLHIDDTSGLSGDEVIARARSMMQKNGNIDLFVVDFAQRQGWGGAKNMHEAINDFCLSYADFAKEANCAFLLLTQLNRAVDQRENHRPELSDMRGSGGLEEQATAVWFLLREEYYLERSGRPKGFEAGQEWEAACDQHRNRADIIIAKNKNGPTKTVNVRSAIGYDRFYSDTFEDEY